jgi:hypothetical protein
MNKKFEFEDNIEIAKRDQELSRFLINIIDKEEQPIFISDQATVFDISSDDENVLLERIKKFYKKEITSSDLSMPLWKLIVVVS